MRLIVMFDLPVETTAEQRAYRQFRKALLSEGFLMMQESIYVRVVTNQKAANLLEKRIVVHVPNNGLIQTLQVTEKQYASMHFLVGEPKKDIKNRDDKVIVI
ncbi:CRISPR-associated endoribonuclease Cas2 [Fructobacillus pseudoficulneus]|uniref:CRISPR-associated endoribonuclease Cas2 n=1 Tax=Fructobacillus pseudoficulneus TaxID=220714 RepID=A0A3F3GW42_9LACO|nr:CRISPR-associated endonuclease Cas2 [Fructobacillus pseudoficulneus]GAP02517.1 CRISPR-associated endoribonuclease Cas2 [Fructobacillus pseudoficulneus]SEH37368.1 CRISPR-associated protein Cas2 [Fructobacillus pseudoficulneus]